MKRQFVSAIVVGLAITLLILRFGFPGNHRRRPIVSQDLVSSELNKAADLDDQPGRRHSIRPNDLPAPFATVSAENFAQIVPRPAQAWPKVPQGFRVQLVATGLANPRKIVTAPNGDLFFSESSANVMKVIRGIDPSGKAEKIETFASGLRQPFGIAFFPRGPNPQFVYVANTDSVVRFPYRNGDLRARATKQTVVPNLPGGGRLEGGGHWTRDIVFSENNEKMYISVGSRTNDQTQWLAPWFDKNRASILEYKPDGSGFRIYAYGIRNAVGLAINPADGVLWASVNERDRLGDDLPPDYITHITAGGFYGWPWYYIGANQDPFHKGEHPELAPKVIVPDVLIQAHSASLCLTFYDGQQFQPTYSGQIFAAEHGSWNRQKHTGYKVIMVALEDGSATGEYEDFMTGFVTHDGQVWGRPVGVTVAQDGALIVTDDGSNSIWRVSSLQNGLGRQKRSSPPLNATP